MNWRSFAIVTMAGFMTLGCDKIPFLGGQAADAARAEAVQDTTPAPATPVAPPVQEPEPEPEPEPVQTVRPALAGEEPWFPVHTGTVRPGMTADDVVAVWGVPVTDRAVGNWTFLYFRNGCELACGTFDVVMLEGGQVVDAIVRGPGHVYEGVSSSPPNRAAQFTPPTFSPDTVGIIG
jgi:hypothetical protein